MLSINGKKFMNLPEAVQWLLDNNALPFQSTASFAPDTEIAKSTIINPSPSELRVGALVLFADGLVGTVNAVTANGFKVGSEATDLSAGVPHITGMEVNASGHLIITMSEGDPIDAGIIKAISGLSIDASQHLIATFNDGTTQDLGAIFQGNVNIAGNFTANSIIENMGADYYFTKGSETPNITREFVYAGCVKNGNKLTLCIALNVTRTDTLSTNLLLGNFFLPTDVMDKLYPTQVGLYNYLDNKKLDAFENHYTSIPVAVYATKGASVSLSADRSTLGNLALNTKYYLRYEVTFLLSENLAA